MTTFASIFSNKSENKILKLMPKISDHILNTIYDNETALHWAITRNYNRLAKQLMIRLSDDIFDYILKSNLHILYNASDEIVIYLFDIISEKLVLNLSNYLNIIADILKFNSKATNKFISKIKVETLNTIINDDTILLLLLCYEHDDEDEIIKVISKMSDEVINFTNKYNYNALRLAYENTYTKFINVLEPIMEKNLLSYDNKFYLSCKFGFEKFANNYITFENIEYIDKDKNDVFLYACMNNMTNVIEKIIEYIEQNNMYHIYNCINNDGQTGFMFICKNNNTNIALKMISHMTKKSLYQYDKDNYHALKYAFDNKMTEIINILVPPIKDYNIIEILKMYSEKPKVAIAKFGPINKFDFSNISFYYILKMLSEYNVKSIIKVLPENVLNMIDISGNSILTAHYCISVLENIIHLLTKDIINHITELNNNVLSILLKNYDFLQYKYIIKFNDDTKCLTNILYKILKKINKNILNIPINNISFLIHILQYGDDLIRDKNDEQLILRCIDLMDDSTLNLIDGEFSALQLACTYNFESIGIKLLDRMSTNVINYNNNCTSALFYACENGLNTLVDLMIPLSTDEILNDTSENISLFQCACINIFPNIVQKMIPRLSTKTICHRAENNTALTIAYNRKSKKLINILEKYVEEQMESIDNKLLFACMNGYEKYAFEHVDNSTDEHFQELGEENNVLYWACYHNMVNLIDDLLPRMTIEAINRKNIDGQTALIYACEKQIENIILKLLPYSTYKNIFRVINQYNEIYNKLILNELTDESICKINQMIQLNQNKINISNKNRRYIY